MVRNHAQKPQVCLARGVADRTITVVVPAGSASNRGVLTESCMFGGGEITRF